MIYVALVRPNGVWVVVLLGLGVVILLLAERLRHATKLVIELTQTQVRDNKGRVLAEIADVVSVERGAFALKPSNGFTKKRRAPGCPACGGAWAGVWAWAARRARVRPSLWPNRSRSELPTARG